MLRLCNYDHSSYDDTLLPRGRTIAHANVCMITNDSDDDDINSYDSEYL